ncbi:XkdX family protein [Clostridium sp. HBUAS56010]|nr:XkdX family protein [Clostridium sp. HBUAS56010]
MSKNFEKVKSFYTAELWSLNWVGDAVGKWITVEEYREITGKEYASEV